MLTSWEPFGLQLILCTLDGCTTEFFQCLFGGDLTKVLGCDIPQDRLALY